MAWLKLHTDIIDDSKLTGLSEAEKWRIVALMCFAKELDKGGLIDQSLEKISWRLRISVSKISKIVQKLDKLRIISNTSEGISFLNWDKRQYNPDYLRLRKHRENKKNDNASDNNDDNGCDNGVITVDTDTERYRAERKKKITTFVSSDKITFDCLTGEFLNLTSEKLEIWKAAYPAVDVEIEIRQAGAWLIDNPKNRKSNYGRFLVNWLSRSQDKAPRENGSRQYGGKPEYKPAQFRPADAGYVEPSEKQMEANRKWHEEFHKRNYPDEKT